MFTVEFNRSGVSSSESLSKIIVIDLHVVNYLSLSIVVCELNLTSKISVVDQKKMGMRSSLSKISSMVLEQCHDFSLKIERSKSVS